MYIYIYVRKTKTHPWVCLLKIGHPGIGTAFEIFGRSAIDPGIGLKVSFYDPLYPSYVYPDYGSRPPQFWLFTNYKSVSHPIYGTSHPTYNNYPLVNSHITMENHNF